MTEMGWKTKCIFLIISHNITYINRIMQHVVFWIWLLSLSMFSGFIYVGVCISAFLFFMTE